MPTDAEISVTIDQVIRQRRTTKVFSDSPLENSTNRQLIGELIETAAWAPFHLPAAAEHLRTGGLDSPVPWRFYLLDSAACRELRERLLAAGDTGKLPRMLAAATAMIQVTWLPNPRIRLAAAPADELFEPTVANMEHIAAASAAVQNLLLAATARAVPSYWSSGGALRGAEAFAWLEIPATEIALGSVFFFPADLTGLETAPGKLREKRGATSQWSRWVSLDAESSPTSCETNRP